jgi:adhesin transport system membrane fusion protein
MSAADFKTMSREMSGREGARNSLILFVVITLLVALGVWAYYTELDNVTRGEGKIVSEMQNQIVQAAEKGVLMRRYVSEGDLVEENEILFEIDPIDASTELNRVIQRFTSLQIKELRLRAEINGEPLSIPNDMRALSPVVASSEESLFQARRSELSGAMAILDQKLLQREQELAEAQVSIRTAANTSELLSQEIALLEPLVAQNAVPETRLLEMRRQLEQASGSQQRADTTALRAEAGMAEVRREMTNRQEEYTLESMGQLSDVVSEMSELNKVIPSLQDRVGRTVVRAPVTGIVNRVNFRTAGGYVQQGDVMLELVPTGDNLVIEARIQPRDISKIRPEDDVRIRLSAYDSTRYGTVDGRVIRISPDATTDPDSQTAESFYVIDVAIEGALLNEAGDQVEYLPGMTATVDVLSGKRSVLEYVWQPVARIQELALRD